MRQRHILLLYAQQLAGAEADVLLDKQNSAQPRMSQGAHVHCNEMGRPRAHWSRVARHMNHAPARNDCSSPFQLPSVPRKKELDTGHRQLEVGLRQRSASKMLVLGQEIVPL